MDFISPSTAIRNAKLISSSSAFLLAGYSLSFSQNTVPALYEHRPQFSAVAFRQIAQKAGLVPALSLISTSSFAYLAYAVPEERREWATAAALVGSTFVWARLVMHKGLERLLAIGGEKNKMEKAEQNLEHRQLMVRWCKQNYVAVVLQMAGAVVGLRTMLRA